MNRSTKKGLDPLLGSCATVSIDQLVFFLLLPCWKSSYGYLVLNFSFFLFFEEKEPSLVIGRELFGVLFEYMSRTFYRSILGFGTCTRRPL